MGDNRQSRPVTRLFLKAMQDQLNQQQRELRSRSLTRPSTSEQPNASKPMKTRAFSLPRLRAPPCQTEQRSATQPPPNRSTESPRASRTGGVESSPRANVAKTKKAATKVPNQKDVAKPAPAKPASNECPPIQVSELISVRLPGSTSTTKSSDHVELEAIIKKRLASRATCSEPPIKRIALAKTMEKGLPIPVDAAEMPQSSKAVINVETGAKAKSNLRPMTTQFKNANIADQQNDDTKSVLSKTAALDATIDKNEIVALKNLPVTKTVKFANTVSVQFPAKANNNKNMKVEPSEAVEALKEDDATDSEDVAGSSQMKNEPKDEPMDDSIVKACGAAGDAALFNEVFTPENWETFSNKLMAEMLGKPVSNENAVAAIDQTAVNVDESLQNNEDVATKEIEKVNLCPAADSNVAPEDADADVLLSDDDEGHFQSNEETIFLTVERLRELIRADNANDDNDESLLDEDVLEDEAMDVDDVVDENAASDKSGDLKKDDLDEKFETNVSDVDFITLAPKESELLKAASPLKDASDDVCSITSNEDIVPIGSLDFDAIDGEADDTAVAMELNSDLLLDDANDDVNEDTPMALDLTKKTDEIANMLSLAINNTLITNEFATLYNKLEACEATFVRANDQVRSDLQKMNSELALLTSAQNQQKQLINELNGRLAQAESKITKLVKCFSPCAKFTFDASNIVKLDLHKVTHHLFRESPARNLHIPVKTFVECCPRLKNLDKTTADEVCGFFGADVIKAIVGRRAAEFSIKSEAGYIPIPATVIFTATELMVTLCGIDDRQEIHRVLRDFYNAVSAGMQDYLDSIRSDSKSVSNVTGIIDDLKYYD